MMFISPTQELSLYEALGVRPFRRLMMAVEKLRHPGGAINRNYHLPRLSPAGAEEYLPRLHRNARLHLISQLLLTLFWACAWPMGLSHWFYPVVSLLLTALNLWCLMLQRYNYLRIQKFINKQKSRQSAEAFSRLCR